MLAFQPIRRHLARRNSLPITFEITTRTRNHATIPMQDHDTTRLRQERDKSFWNFSPLQIYYKFASAVGIVDCNSHSTSGKLEIARMIKKLLMHGLGMVFNLYQLKHNIMVAILSNETNNIGLYIGLMDRFVRVSLRIYFTVSTFRNPNSISELLSSIKGTSFFKEQSSFKELLLTILAFITVCLGSVGLPLYQIVKDPMTYIQKSGNSMIDFFLVWNSSEYAETSNFANYGVTIGLGVLQIFTTIIANLIEQTAKVGVFAGIMSFARYCEKFTFKETPPGIEASILVAAEVDGKKMIVARYEELKQISRRINKAFFPLLRIMVLGYLFMSAAFFDKSFRKDEQGIKKGILFAELMVACIMYYLASECGRKGDRFRGWIRFKKNRENLNLSQLDAIQEEQFPQSVGVGKGALFINDAFMIGCGSGVLAYFLGIVETRPKPDEICNCTCNCITQNGTSI